ncbi:MAG: hypothetical protein AAGI90_04580 [Chlamydiota bacterium]
MTDGAATKNPKGIVVLPNDDPRGEKLLEIVNKIQNFGGEKRPHIKFSAAYCVLARNLQKNPCECKTVKAVTLFFQEEKEEVMKSLVPHALHQCKQLPLLDRHPEWAEDIPQELLTFAQTNDFWKSLHMLHEIHHSRIKEMFRSLGVNVSLECPPVQFQGIPWELDRRYDSVFPDITTTSLGTQFHQYIYTAVKNAVNTTNYNFSIFLLAAAIVADITGYQGSGDFLEKESLDLIIYTAITCNNPVYLAQVFSKLFVLKKLFDNKDLFHDYSSEEAQRYSVKVIAVDFMKRACKQIHDMHNPKEFFKQFCIECANKENNPLIHSALFESMIPIFDYTYLQDLIKIYSDKEIYEITASGDQVLFNHVDCVIENISYMKNWKACEDFISDHSHHLHKDLSITDAIYLKIIVSATQESPSQLLASILRKDGGAIVSRELLNALINESSKDLHRELNKSRWDLSGLCHYFIRNNTKKPWIDPAYYNLIPEKLITPSGTYNKDEIAFQYLSNVFHCCDLHIENFLPPNPKSPLSQFWKRYFCRFVTNTNNDFSVNYYAQKLLQHFHTICPEDPCFLEEIFSSISNFEEARYCADLLNKTLIRYPDMKMGKKIYKKLFHKMAERSCALQETALTNSSDVDPEYKKYIPAIHALQQLYDSSYYVSLNPEQSSSDAASNTLQQSQTSSKLLQDLKNTLNRLCYVQNPLSLFATLYRQLNGKNIHEIVEEIEPKRGVNSFSGEFVTKMQNFVQLAQRLLSAETMEEDKHITSHRKRVFKKEDDSKESLAKRTKNG